ncbi:SPFH domain, Band 7 family protein [Thalassoporum mexicanum PCC 7367]|uniref:prohibitin family protein n=1 Tax=Thalassoporum mexicanum TaxID=3457544 RepID=UPI00029F947B|nr:prohibitin family protein [Pseudanabaena sp. PCC 7367]AFY70989.1 SPFH domain, Band 7 family protein [Pseudanabaena sp. PCC 7367]
MGAIISLLVTLICVFTFFSAHKLKDSRAIFIVQALSLLVGVLSVIVQLLRTITVVPVGNVGVEEFQGRVSTKVLEPGFYVINPLADVINFSTRLKDITETIEATSQEGLAFNIDVSIQYQLEPSKVVEVYERIGTDESQIVIPRIRSTVREITSGYPIEAIYSEKRLEVGNKIRTRLREQIEPLGFDVEEVLLREVVLPETMQAAIQQKLKAEQESKQMVFVLEREEQEAERKRIESKGIADSQTILAEGLTAEILQLKSIEATEKLAESPNSKVIILGGGNGDLPVLLQMDPTASQ